MRIGMGYDVHRLQEGCKLIMGGVEIPYEKGLLGHSDADVLVHAVMDALLGAAALGDIGKHFPDTDPAYKGISSILLLQKVGELLEEHCFLIENIDATIIAQAPKMRPHIDQMRQNMADALKIDVSQINVKATTEEGLGFTGAGEGISAQAICLLNSPMGLYDQNVTSGCGGCGGGCGEPYVETRTFTDIVTLTEENFEDEVLRDPGLIVIDFWAEWCQPCKMMAPIFDELNKEEDKVKFCKINVDEQPNLASMFGIDSIPTLAVVQDRHTLTGMVGVHEKADIKAMLEQCKA